jgi:hypothetical protein
MLFPSRLLRPLLLLALLGGGSVSAKVTVESNGEIVIPAADCKIAEGSVTANFKAKRWGMYSLSVDGGGSPLEARINGEATTRKGKGTVGDFYLKKAGDCVIELKGATKGVTALHLKPACEGTPVVQKRGEAIELDAKDSVVEGVMLRYEPNPKKLCLGFWGNAKDRPRWDFTVTTPGTYEVILTQGCGRGAGGSAVVLEIAGSALEFTVKDTGGYQNWVERPLGKVRFKKAGKQALTLRVLKKGRGIMDVRRIVLKPTAK